MLYSPPGHGEQRRSTKMFSKVEGFVTRGYVALQVSLAAGEEGQGLVEYGLAVALLAIAAVATMTTLGTTVAAKFTSITGSL
jgi:Flp pilus assembly pilin Flp